MRLDSLDYLCCPKCQGNLRLFIEGKKEKEVIQGALNCTLCESQFKIQDGLPNLIFPKSLKGSDLSAQKFYDERPMYDYRPTAFRLGIWSRAFRRSANKIRWAERLEACEGGSVLEVAAGNGNNLASIARVLGRNGCLNGLDVSSMCLKMARKRLQSIDTQIELIQGNASYLPYKSEMFDGVLSVGGFNDFCKSTKAINEMHRVSKPGAKIVIMDEGLSPDREKTLLGRYILKCMDAFEAKPPERKDLPDNIKDLKIYWIYQETFWVLEYRKASPTSR
jgi:ubiquinone/menaquinone biosynthesis C-methylase UbiE/uncharacterized protein YbaR (Trm112 family)